MILKNFFRKNIIFFAISILALFLYSDSALAAATYNSLIPIPGMASKIPNNPDALEYLGGLYKFLISAVGIVAMTAIVIGGARYLTSVGNPSAIEDAKNTIWSAIWGLLLALASWVIVWTINPDITLLKKPNMPWEGGKYEPTAAGNDCGKERAGTCVCNDGVTIPKKTATKIDLKVSPGPSVAASSNFTFSGKLTNSDGTLLPAGKKVTAIIYSTKENKSLVWTDIAVNATDGSFSKTDFVNCKSDLTPNKVQAIFQGDSQYAGSGSNIMDLTITSTTASNCNYDKNISLFSSSCNADCSDFTPANFHCAVKPKLTIGRSLDLAEEGYTTKIIAPSPAKSAAYREGDVIFYDAHIDDLKKNSGGLTIGRIDVNLGNGSWSLWGSNDYTCIYESVCKGVSESMKCSVGHDWVEELEPKEDGKFTVATTTAITKTLASTLKVTYINPNTGACDIEVKDKNVIVEFVR